MRTDYKFVLLSVLAFACLHAQQKTSEISSAELRALNGDKRPGTMPCVVSQVKPAIGLDLRFHAGYVATVPIRAMDKGGEQVRLLTRITPVDEPARALFFEDAESIPQFPAKVSGDLEIAGHYDLGPGRYHVDWVLVEPRGPLCSARWETEALLKNDLKDALLSLPANTADIELQDPFHEIPAVSRDRQHSLSVKILVSFSSGSPSQSSVRRGDIQAVTSMLRVLAREPRFASFRVVFFSIEEERVLYRSDPAPRIDFSALKKAVQDLRLGTVAYRQLQDPGSSRKFLTRLLTENLGAQEPHTDAIVIVSPQLALDQKVPREALESAGRADCPIFYLHYNDAALLNIFGDPISKALKVYRGLEYSITAPRDLGSAVTDIMSRLTAR